MHIAKCDQSCSFLVQRTSGNQFLIQTFRKENLPGDIKNPVAGWALKIFPNSHYFLHQQDTALWLRLRQLSRICYKVMFKNYYSQLNILEAIVVFFSPQNLLKYTPNDWFTTHSLQNHLLDACLCTKSWGERLKLKNQLFSKTHCDNDL